MTVFGVAGLVAVVLVVVVLVVVLATAVLLIARARRLDHLHRRVDAAWAALVGVLDRRAAVVRTVAAAPSAVVPASERRALRAAARGAEEARGGEERETAENDLARVLAGLDVSVLPTDVAAELADADARVVVARRVYHDAVRDTRALRGRRMVRVLRLAGSAPFPRYFEIVESGVAAAVAPAVAVGTERTAGPDRPAGTGRPAVPGSAVPGSGAPDGPAPASGGEPAGPAVDAPGHDPTATGPFAVPRMPAPTAPPPARGREAAGAPARASGPRSPAPPATRSPSSRPPSAVGPPPLPPGAGDGAPRRARDAARVVALDADGRVLLLRADDPEAPGDPGSFWFLPGGAVEPGEEPARAAARAFAAATGRVCPVEAFAGPVWLRDVRFTAGGVAYAARERFFLLPAARGEVDTTGVTGLGRRRVGASRWWTPAELAVTLDVVHPRQLADLVSDPASLRPPDAPISVR